MQSTGFEPLDHRIVRLHGFVNAEKDQIHRRQHRDGHDHDGHDGGGHL
jgi:hypothetical protein